MTETITTADGAQIPVADIPEETDAIATRLTLSGTEKVNTGNYENEEFYASLRLELRPAIRLGTADANRRVEKLADIGRDQIDDHLARSIEASEDARKQGVEDF